MWMHLRSRQLDGAKFRRQERIGPFIVDFCCLEPKVVLEIDGGQHAVRIERDAERTAFLERSGYRVVRLWNAEVLEHIDGVLERIAETLARSREHSKEK